MEVTVACLPTREFAFSCALINSRLFLIHTMIPTRISLVAVLAVWWQPKQLQKLYEKKDEKHTNMGEASQNSLSNHRILFAERWSDPSNPQRGGAGGAAKCLTEFVPMRPPCRRGNAASSANDSIPSTRGKINTGTGRCRKQKLKKRFESDIRDPHRIPQEKRK